MDNLLEKIKFNEKGLVPVIAQDYETGQVLMLAYMNRETLLETFETGKMIYWSRSRNTRWFKGETSGHIQTVKEIYIDCDGDTLLFKIHQKGCACHEGYYSCFFRRKDNNQWNIVSAKAV